MPDQPLSIFARRAIIGAYVLGGVALLYPCFWNPVWELGKGFGLIIHHVPWDSPHVQVALLVTLVLTIAGTLGGLAYHIGRAGLVMPVWEKNSDGKPLLNLGFIGDGFLGAVAANALHFPLSAMVAYKNLSNATEAAQSWLALAALGILGGYAGGILLKRWSDSLVASMSKEIEENRKLVNKALGENEQLWEQRRKDENEILFRALDDAATTKQSLDTTAATLLKRRAKEVGETKAKSGLAAVNATDSMVAAYAAYHSGNYEEAAELLEHALKNNLDPELVADAENLLGLCYHYRSNDLADWFEKAEAIYKRALQRNPDQLTTAILTTNYGYLLSDHSDFASAAEKLDVVRAQRDALGNRRKLADVAALGAASAYTKLVIGGDATAGAKALAALTQIEYPESLRYLILDGSIPADVIAAWKAKAEVPAGIKSIL